MNLRRRDRFLAEKSLGCVKSEKTNLLHASSCFRKQQRTLNADQAAGNQGRDVLLFKVAKPACLFMLTKGQRQSGAK